MGISSGKRIPIEKRAMVIAMRSHGLSKAEIAKRLLVSVPSVTAILANGEDEIANKAAEILKKDLPRELRRAAAVYLGRALDPVAVAATSGRDAAVAAGIFLDKAALMEQEGNQINILVQVQSRIDQVEQTRLVSAAKQELPAPIEDAIVVQPCPPKATDNSAPPKTSKSSPAKPRQKRVSSRVR